MPSWSTKWKRRRHEEYDGRINRLNEHRARFAPPSATQLQLKLTFVYLRN